LYTNTLLLTLGRDRHTVDRIPAQEHALFASEGNINGITCTET